MVKHASESFAGDRRRGPNRVGQEPVERPPRGCVDVSRIERAFGFRAATPFEVGLRNTIDWYLSSSHSGETL